MPATNKCLLCEHGIPKKPGKVALSVKIKEKEKILYVSQETYLSALGGDQKLEIRVNS